MNMRDSDDEDKEEGIEEERIDSKEDEAVTTAKIGMLQKKRAMMTKMVSMRMKSMTIQQRR